MHPNARDTDARPPVRSPLRLESRLPEVGTTIFTVMSALAREVGAINLSQGFPDFPIDPELADRVDAAIRAGHNQYAPMTGIPELRSAIAAKIRRTYGVPCDPDTQVNVTAGATQAVFTAIGTVARPGDEVIVLDPAFDSYAPAIRLFGATPVHVPLSAGMEFGEDAAAALEAAITSRTRLLLLNSPHNPSGRILRQAELDRIAGIVGSTGAFVLSDEVYEHIVFDGEEHASVLAHPELAERSFAVFSFGKVFHATGWKMGYAVAPPTLMAEFRKAHQFNVFCVNTPAQHALAGYLADPAHWEGLPAFYQRKRDRFREGLRSSRFRLLPCEGSYFQMADYGAVSDLPDVAFAEWLTREHGVATIPLSPFYRDPPEGQRLIRFCFGKEDATLDAAIERLRQV